MNSISFDDKSKNFDRTIRLPINNILNLQSSVSNKKQETIREKEHNEHRAKMTDVMKKLKIDMGNFDCCLDHFSYSLTIVLLFHYFLQLFLHCYVYFIKILSFSFFPNEQVIEALRRIKCVIQGLCVEERVLSRDKLINQKVKSNLPSKAIPISEFLKIIVIFFSSEQSLQRSQSAQSSLSQDSSFNSFETQIATNLTTSLFLSSVPKTFSTEALFVKQPITQTTVTNNLDSITENGVSSCCCCSDCCFCKRGILSEIVSLRHILQLKRIIIESIRQLKKPENQTETLFLISLSCEVLSSLIADSAHLTRIIVLNRNDSKEQKQEVLCESLFSSLLTIFSIRQTTSNSVQLLSCLGIVLHFLCVCCCSSRDAVFELLRCNNNSSVNSIIPLLLSLCKRIPAMDFPFYDIKTELLDKKFKTQMVFDEYLLDTADCDICLCCKVKKIRSSPLCLMKYATKLLSVFVNVWFQVIILFN